MKRTDRVYWDLGVNPGAPEGAGETRDDEQRSTGITTHRAAGNWGRRRRGGGGERERSGRPQNGHDRPAGYDPTKVNITNVFDAPEPTLRIDNHNGRAVRVKIGSTGASNGDEYTVGANQAGFRPPEGKYVSAECGETITDLWVKRPNEPDSEYVEVLRPRTRVVGGEGCP